MDVCRSLNSPFSHQALRQEGASGDKQHQMEKFTRLVSSHKKLRLPPLGRRSGEGAAKERRANLTAR